MSLPPARSVFGLTLRRCLRLATLPTLATGLGAFALAKATAPEVLADAPGAAAPWLVLTMLVVSAAVTAITLTFWPAFAARRPGREVTARLQRGPLEGCGAAVLAALCAQALLNALLLAALAAALDAPATAHAHRSMPPPAHPLLTADQPRLRFALPDATTATAVELRPLAGPPAGELEGSRLRVLVDGEALQGTAVFEQTGQLAVLTFAPRALGAVEVLHEGGNVPLFFPDGSVVAVEAAARPLLANAAWAALLGLLPTAVALAFACLLGAVAALPTVTTVVMVLLFVQTTGGVGPAGPALHQLMRGEWIGDPGVFAATSSSLATGCAAMIGAMLVRRRRHP